MSDKAIVIGAGIGGLACAAALAQRGIAVTVLEQADAIREVGAGLQISPNGLNVLSALGCTPALHQTGAVKAEAVVLEDGLDGRTVARLDLARTAPGQYLCVHRADLVSVLASTARDLGVVVELGCRVRRVLPGAAPGVELDDGTRRNADIVICADGLHSVGRNAFGEAPPAHFTGQAAWRATVPLRGPVPPEVHVVMGPGRHLVSYPLRGGRLLNLVAVEERTEWTEEGWAHGDDPMHLRRAFAGLMGTRMHLLHNVSAVNIWGLFRHPVAASWYSDGVALLGDAAHPTLPFLAQGANLALEDAWVLAQCVAEGDLVAYQGLREARVRRVIAAAESNAWKYHMRPGLARSAAHTALRIASRAAPGLLVGQFDWIYRKDVTA
ncbi:FAD-dependent monooxygenase [Sulfitobacter sp. D35]|uniref:FAD-dependent monooxygenase n=1 Tax=Sulfitobacter sp. D35 TaxID=3083252 RepID=UPI00296FD8E8|nr:FAD-dependent monooxygenase [Sulfitobacter sp. D35]